MAKLENMDQIHAALPSLLDILSADPSAKHYCKSQGHQVYHPLPAAALPGAASSL